MGKNITKNETGGKMETKGDKLQFSTHSVGVGPVGVLDNTVAVISMYGHVLERCIVAWVTGLVGDAHDT